MQDGLDVLARLGQGTPGSLNRCCCAGLHLGSRLLDRHSQIAAGRVDPALDTVNSMIDNGW